MAKLNNLEHLFHHQLRYLYNAEKQLIEDLPQIRKQAASQKLRTAFSDHIKETKKHEIRLTDIAKSLDTDLSGETCEAMQGLIKEVRSFIENDADDMVLDAGIIASAQCIEHYEISAYGTALRFAKMLNHEVAVDRLQDTLNEEKDADQVFNILAEDVINPKAQKS